MIDDETSKQVEQASSSLDNCFQWHLLFLQSPVQCAMWLTVGPWKIQHANLRLYLFTLSA